MRSKSYSLKVILIIACYGLSAGGCKKLIDYVKGHGDGDYKACNIRKITVYNYSPFDTAHLHVDTLVYTFTYNKLGDPVSVIHNLVTTGNPNYFFKYDKYNRLSQSVRPYEGNSNYERWNKYGYNNKGQIVKDTSYAFGQMSGGEPQPSPLLAYTSYEYDTKGRIISYVDSLYAYGTFSFATIHNLAYDANGNLVGPAYDNKLSLNRTNNVWMFITRDYSVNNPFTALQYNDNQLPLSVYGGNALSLIIGAGGPEYRIEYFCH